MDADYGGTEICSALQLALGSRNSQMPTVVFVLTDGEVHLIHYIFMNRTLIPII